MTHAQKVERRPEERIIVTIDAKEDMFGLLKIAQDLGERARAFKLGQQLLLHSNPWAPVRMLRSRGVEVDFDAKYEENADQMAPLVSDAFQKGFKHVSIAPASGTAALIRATEVVPPGCGLFAAMPDGNDRLVDILVDEILEANEALGPDKQIREVMCNVGDIQRIKAAGDFIIIAAGIRMPGDGPDDHPHVATPAEALAMGAEYLAVGRSITSKQNRAEAFEQILENIATYR